MMRHALVAVVVLAVTVAVGGQATPPAPQIPITASKALVSIKGTAVDGKATSGCGFIVDPSGIIVTNLHVVAGLKSATVTLPAGDVSDSVSVRAFDTRRDLAVLQVPAGNLPTIKLGNSEGAKVDDRVLLIGHRAPSGLSATAGAITAIQRLADYQIIEINGAVIPDPAPTALPATAGATASAQRLKDHQIIEIKGAVIPGSVSGPMLNAEGEVVGVLTFADNRHLAVPINYVKDLLKGDERLSLSQLGERLRATAVPNFPTHWRSLVSGRDRRIHLEEDFAYVQNVLTDDQAHEGNFQFAELKRSGDRYVGRFRLRTVCGRAFKLCLFDAPYELTLVTPWRVEGLAPQFEGAPDCEKCQWSSKPMPFVWVPGFLPE